MSEIIINPLSRFSELSIWQHQKKYYAEKGLSAWANDVPSYVTCNPFIARHYAKTVINFMRDWLAQQCDASDHPFYIFELGAGTGQFGFYFLKSFLEFQKIFQLEKLKIKYVMTDATESLLSFWKTHPALLPFIDNNLLEFAIFDLCNPVELTLYLSQKKILSADIQNPPVIIANYIFDSIPIDLFRIQNGNIDEVLVSLKTTPDNLQGDVFQDLQKITFEFHEKNISEKYYHNALDALLFCYQNDLMDAYLQFPIQLLTCMNQFKTVCNGRFLLLSSDKGHAALEELDHVDLPKLTYHGNCFSIMVNFHALSHYMKMQAGDCIVQEFRDHILTGVFSCGFLLKNLPALHFSASEMVHEFSPTDYFDLYKNMGRNYKHATAEELLSFLSLSHWDGRFFAEICDYLIELYDTIHPDTLHCLIKNIPKIAEQFYYFPGCLDTYFNIAILYQGIHDFEKAIRHYQRSIDYFGESDVVLFNMAMCHYSLQRKSEALALLHRAAEKNPNLPQIHEMIMLIQGGT